MPASLYQSPAREQPSPVGEILALTYTVTMLTIFQAIVLGLMQGISELFPVSSLGHSVIVPGVLGWKLDQNADGFLAFLVATHFATALVLLWIYRRDWRLIIKGIFRSLRAREIGSSDAYAKLGWLIIVATIPAGIAGVLFEDKLKTLFVSPLLAAAFLIANGLLLFGSELFMKKRGDALKKAADSDGSTDGRIARLSWGDAVKTGCMQMLALVPGLSRTGSAMAGSLLAGLSREDALRFSFLLATPIIGAAALLKLPELAASGDAGAIHAALAGALAAAAAAYLSARFLARYFKSRTLMPFALYCVIAGALSLAVLLLRAA